MCSSWVEVCFVAIVAPCFYKYFFNVRDHAYVGLIIVFFFVYAGGVANAVIPNVEEQKAKQTATDPEPERMSVRDRPKEVPGGKTT